LDMGIAQGGAKIIHQRAYPIDGFPAVHGREGEPCVGCGGTVKKITVATRGTYFCTSCQRLRNPKPSVSTV
jgi:formamidopyrimidine-DNA glycosylase